MRRLWLLLTLLASPALAVDDPFDAFLSVPHAVADGFDVPSRGEVRALAHGRVAEVAPESLVVEHVFYENHHRRMLRATHERMERIDVVVGAELKRGSVLGRGARSRVRLSVDGQEVSDVAAFLRARRSLPVPQEEARLLVVDHGTARMRLYERGRRLAEYDVGFGQSAGAKERRGDLRTPTGMYFVVARSRGPFTGDYAEYYGGHWVKLNYPNAYDADRGLREGLITSAQRELISARWRERKLTLQSTELGGGIGFHGWVSEWTRAQTQGRLSWGCVVMHNPDIARAFDDLPLGAMVVLLDSSAPR